MPNRIVGFLPTEKGPYQFLEVLTEEEWAVLDRLEVSNLGARKTERARLGQLLTGGQEMLARAEALGCMTTWKDSEVILTHLNREMRDSTMFRNDSLIFPGGLQPNQPIPILEWVGGQWVLRPIGRNIDWADPHFRFVRKVTD